MMRIILDNFKFIIISLALLIPYCFYGVSVVRDLFVAIGIPIIYSSAIALSLIPIVVLIVYRLTTRSE